jgi:peptidyl-prolyl cis-trans isomerase A (cyclophilin A)
MRVPTAVVFFLAVLGSVSAAQKLPQVMIQTDVGSMEVQIDSARFPGMAANFLRHVDHGAYRGGRFHRTVRAENQSGDKVEIEVIQGGLDPSRSEEVAPMALERKKDTGLSLGDDAVTMPRETSDPGTAEFFIRVGNPPELGILEPDGQRFAAFGLVVRGMEVVRLIHTARAQGERLRPPIGILNITRLK